MPKCHDGSHLKEPLNPFKPFHNDEEFKAAIKEISKHDAGVLRITESELKHTTDYMLTDKQYEDLFQNHKFANDATYGMLKLI